MSRTRAVDMLWMRLIRAWQGHRTAGGDAPPAVASAFTEWMVCVEPALRRSLARFAPYVDVEGVCQEALLRMWMLSEDIAGSDGDRLSESDASRRYLIRMGRNLTLNLIRKHRRERPLDDETLEFADPTPVSEPDPMLRARVQQCFSKQEGRPGQAIQVRLAFGHLPESEQAERAGMTRNTFHQNIARARKAIEVCLARFGIILEEVLP